MKGPKSLTVVIKLGNFELLCTSPYSHFLPCSGTSSIVDEKTHQPLLSILSLIVETAVKLRSDGHKVILVSSGAIGVGLRRMDVEKKPKHLPRLQALAAVGQCRLMSLWDSLFGHLRQPVAQVLLTRNDIRDRSQYINAQNTLSELLSMGVIPIVNENDTLAVSEIKFGDNDTLSAITAAMISADYLFLMTDVDCLYDRNPRTFPDAKPIEVVSDISSLEADVSSAGSALGTGGMNTKIVAAKLATSAGVTTVITRSSKPGNISEIVAYLQSLLPINYSPDPSPSSSQILPIPPSTLSIPSSNIVPLSLPPLHTRFLASPTPIRSRSIWLLHALPAQGILYIDRGAHHALSRFNANLLPAGVVSCSGTFSAEECVRIVAVDRKDPLALDGTSSTFPSAGEEVGRAVVNYSSVEIGRIKGLRSSQIESVLGYADSEYVALRENIGFFRQEGLASRPQTPAEGMNGTPEGVESG
ncbi:MAG: hypothetical protein Q9227_006307 [Pyrenula ochraceoflavens]